MGKKYLKDGVLPHMWCAGCGIGVMLGALLRSFEELGYAKNEVVVVTGIGCTGKTDDYLTTNALHTTHGRALAFATGIKAFKPELKVVVLMGDGDGVTIGGNHFIHAARRNIDLTAIVVNNFNFGMTGGQASGTTPGDKISSTTLYGNPERDFDVSALACTAGANYVARTTPAHGWEMTQHIKKALTKKGFSLVEVLSPCPTNYGKNNKMKNPLQMLSWLKERCLSPEAYAQLSEAEKDDYFVIGKICDCDVPDFNTRYEEIRARAMNR
jgi:2-oxoglutarate/2-oxoacid ferredoxin oxidoreductase subunit beta